MRPKGLKGASHRGGGAAKRRGPERAVGHTGGALAKARRKEMVRYPHYSVVSRVIYVILDSFSLISLIAAREAKRKGESEASAGRGGGTAIWAWASASQPRCEANAVSGGRATGGRRCAARVGVLAARSGRREPAVCVLNLPLILHLFYTLQSRLLLFARLSYSSPSSSSSSESHLCRMSTIRLNSRAARGTSSCLNDTPFSPMSAISSFVDFEMQLL